MSLQPEAEPRLSGNALKILEMRYLMHEGDKYEKPAQLFWRVAQTIAQAEAFYGSDDSAIQAWAETFYKHMCSMYFLPNSPTLMNAGRPLGQLSACFVLPIEDSMEGIFSAVGNAALVHKSGGGTGFDFSQLRPKNALVKSTGGVASGPVAFLKVFNAATEAVKQGGVRRGANMGILRVDHPDIREFIHCKTDNMDITNFNLSIAITDDFMTALQEKREISLIHNGKEYEKVAAEELWQEIIQSAWGNGEPGIVFIDRMNEHNPVEHIGRIKATNPCGEQPLLDNESCNLGSINLALMIKNRDGHTEVDYDLLAEVIQAGVRFLDDVIDVNKYPLPQIREASLLTRKIGLGVMGFADMLFQLKIGYHSPEAVRIAEEIMTFIQAIAQSTSAELAKERGCFPAWKGSRFEKEGRLMRNATLTTVAPTGSISMISGCSSGIEPAFALAYVKTVLDGTQLLEVNPYFAAHAHSEGFYNSSLMAALSQTGRVGDLADVPEEAKEIFVTAQEISPEAHIAIQAAFQKHIDNAVSKTINFGNNATEEDINHAYRLAYQSGCKGLTVYRDGSRDVQVYRAGTKKDSAPVKDDRKSFNNPDRFTTRPRPAVTKGEIEKFSIGCGSLFVMSSRDDIGLAEVFCETGKFGGCASQSEATGRLISYCLRLGRSPEEIEAIAGNIIEQLRGIRCPACIRRPGITVTSCPDAISRALLRQFPNLQKKVQPATMTPTQFDQLSLLHSSGADEVVTAQTAGIMQSALPVSNPCPECGQELIPESGCFTCSNCGYSKCG